MALLAVRRKSCTYVIRVRRAIEILLVTADAVSRRSLELPAYVARHAVQTGMRAGEGESSQAMIELCSLPCVHRRVALLAIGRKAQCAVIGRRRAHIAAHVTTHTIRRQAFETSDGSILVA